MALSSFHITESNDYIFLKKKLCTSQVEMWRNYIAVTKNIGCKIYAKGRPQATLRIIHAQMCTSVQPPRHLWGQTLSPS